MLHLLCVATAATTRRAVLQHSAGAAATAAAAFALPRSSALAAGGQLSARQLLSDVPVFAITNSKGAPYLTGSDSAGRRTGSFYLSPKEALEQLENVRAFDARASLSILPLGGIWDELPHSSAEAARMLSAAPQPKAGTSTDLRLFQLEPISDERAAVRQVLGKAGAPADGTVPLYWEPSLLIKPDGASEAQRPYFFRLADLQATLAQAEGAPATPDYRALRLAELVEQEAKGRRGEPPPLLFVASDAAAVVERTGMNGNAASGAPGGTGAASGEDEQMQRLVDLCLKVPFAKAALT
mmetsp:Transcript_36339/g.118723  ORF Transcript_36339/g.118723 Transcript_36339/m.118723 type:complete len:297 (+) Transcript_36339:58-948(+)